MTSDVLSLHLLFLFLCYCLFPVWWCMCHIQKCIGNFEENIDSSVYVHKKVLESLWADIGDN